METHVSNTQETIPARDSRACGSTPELPAEAVPTATRGCHSSGNFGEQVTRLTEMKAVMVQNPNGICSKDATLSTTEERCHKHYHRQC